MIWFTGRLSNHLEIQQILSFAVVWLMIQRLVTYLDIVHFTNVLTSS